MYNDNTIEVNSEKIEAMRKAKAAMHNYRWELEQAKHEVIDALCPELRNASRDVLLALREVLPELIKAATWRERHDRERR